MRTFGNLVLVGILGAIAIELVGKRRPELVRRTIRRAHRSLDWCEERFDRWQENLRREQV